MNNVIYTTTFEYTRKALSIPNKYVHHTEESSIFTDMADSEVHCNKLLLFDAPSAFIDKWE